MSRQFHRPLVVAITAALGLAILAPVVHADPQQAMSMREERARRQAEFAGKKGHAEEEAKPPLYPEATRQSPEAKVSPKISKHMQTMQARFKDEDWAGVIAKADEVGAMSGASAYEKAAAYSMAGNAAASMDDRAKAEMYFSKAIAMDALDNDNQYSTMFNLAAIQNDEEKYADALATLDRFLAETHSDKPEHRGFRAGLLSNLNRNDEAAAIYKKLIAENPGDKRSLMNGVVALQNADRFAEANELLEMAYAQGMLKEPGQLRALYVGYINAKRWNDAKRVIEDGAAKGILQPGKDLGTAYQLLAQNAFYEDQLPLAIELYTKAAPMMEDGEGYLNLAKALDMAGKKAEAKAAAKQALEKGVKKPEDANRLLSR